LDGLDCYILYRIIFINLSSFLSLYLRYCYMSEQWDGISWQAIAMRFGAQKSRLLE
jgi:hypothetical protein